MLSVIVTTFNRPEHLLRCLEGLAQERSVTFEVIVGDDGSAPATANAVAEFAKEAPFVVEHVWQEDEGFRAARIRNLSVKAAKGDRILFLDGDCVPLPGFLARHAAGGDDDVLAGTRLFLAEAASESLSREQIRRGHLERRIPRREFQRVRWTSIKNLVYRHLLHKERPKVVTANLSVSRAALDKVNGLDERFVGWGYEDDDLRRRLVRDGFCLRSVFNSARVCHLWHPSVDSFPGRVRDTANVDYFRRGFFLSRCRNGLVDRPLESCTIAWNGDGAAGNDTHDNTCEISIAWGASPRWHPKAEVRVLLQPATGDSSAPLLDAHVVLRHPSTSALEPTRGLDVVCEEAFDGESAGGRAAVLRQLEAII